MGAVSRERMVELLQPYLGDIAERAGLMDGLGAYLELLLKWNARTNLTAIREPEEMVRRHFGESLFVGRVLREKMPEARTLLDFGSGAGFPGVPVAMLWPEVRVTLAESQGKKAAFLREVVRGLGLQTAVWGRRVEELPAERRFAAVTMRAVDDLERMLPLARARVAGGGRLALLGGAGVEELLAGAERVRVPEAAQGWLYLE